MFRCRKLNRWVSVQILYGHEMLSISIINPSRPVQITRRSNRLDKAGPSAARVWLAHVEDILEKYHAEYTFSFEVPDLFLLLTGQIQITKATNPCC